MEQFAIGADLESAPARRNERERLDALAELKNFGRQTDGLRRVVSNDAIFDRYLGFHRQSPFRNESIDAIKSGQGMSRRTAVLCMTQRLLDTIAWFEEV
jgi:hypothetical protein